MRNLIFIMVVSVVYTACTGTTTASNESASSSASSSSVAFPYTADYSSDFSKGSDSNTLIALNNIKAWEANDMAALKNTYADTVTFNFSDGFKWTGGLDSVMYYSKFFRDSLSQVVTKPVAFTSLRSNNKNQDWVEVWYKETSNHITGKIDSGYYHNDY